MNKITVGWREWLSLPELGISHIKAEVDTGARTSALHAFSVEPYHENETLMVRVKVHPFQDNVDFVQEFVAPVVDQRWVSDSGGHREQRYVISTPIAMGDQRWDAEVTLTNRDTMKFRMLLGRTAMDGRVIVDPEASFLQGGKPGRSVAK